MDIMYGSQISSRSGRDLKPRPRAGCHIKWGRENAALYCTDGACRYCTVHLGHEGTVLYRWRMNVLYCTDGALRYCTVQ